MNIIGHVEPTPFRQPLSLPVKSVDGTLKDETGG